MNHKILEALREHGALYADEIAQIVGLDKGVIVDALRQLADDFQIYQIARKASPDTAGI